jgi:hypothetical protein
MISPLLTVSDLVHHNDSSRWFVISSPPPICCSNFSFTGGVAKEYITRLVCENIFLQGHILSTAGDALTIENVSSLYLIRRVIFLGHS